MTTYNKSTKELVLEWVAAHLTGFETFHAADVVDWFAASYPRLDYKTVLLHLEGMSVNNGAHRRHHKHVRADTDWDHFLKLAPRTYRRHDPRIDPKPVYD